MKDFKIMKWISIKEKLPNKDTEVLVWNEKNKEIDIDTINDEFKKYFFQTNYPYWMPLPKAPK